MAVLTIAEIAKRLGLPESSARYYRDRFSAYVPSVGEGRTRRYPPEAVDVLREAASLSRSGMPSDQVDAELRRRFPLSGIARPQSAAAEQQQQDAEPQALALADDAATMRALLAELIQTAVRSETEPLKEEIAGLRAELARLTEELEASRPIVPEPELAATPEVAASEPPRRWWQLWKTP